MSMSSILNPKSNVDVTPDQYIGSLLGDQMNQITVSQTGLTNLSIDNLEGFEIEFISNDSGKATYMVACKGGDDSVRNSMYLFTQTADSIENLDPIARDVLISEFQSGPKRVQVVESEEEEPKKVKKEEKKEEPKKNFSSAGFNPFGNFSMEDIRQAQEFLKNNPSAERSIQGFSSTIINPSEETWAIIDGVLDRYQSNPNVQEFREKWKSTGHPPLLEYTQDDDIKRMMTEL
eukprot:CAMPEP_0117434432 /NCGR_PEP_ID=MMETSP0758-20121206/13679_1 /TAXON_ID=63605 /ORGANISM="Percolomonas cosmopolitus, Strain AE-1 (ATCC 50343)" /LENGTH=232 /DNA_ID=CAMNT_0005225861 /DNA_START=209 /DNA_END=903 /DNA_ORIENTATION=+